MVIALFGPTGVGKTEVACALADRLRGRGLDPVAVSADALQVYRGLELLTAAPSQAQRARLEHRLVGFVEVTRTFSAGEFMPLAHTEIDSALQSSRTPIVVGGTGLYLRAALCDLELRPAPPDELRRRLEREMSELGPLALYRRLRARDPDYADKIAASDRSRIIRALELAEMGSALPERANSLLFTQKPRHPTLVVGLSMKRGALYERIDLRVDEIVRCGAVEEVKRADRNGASKTARKAVGFKELLAGDIETMKRRSRNYAKRQLTWMRKLADVCILDMTARAEPEVAADIDTLFAKAEIKARTG